MRVFLVGASGAIGARLVLPQSWRAGFAAVYGSTKAAPATQDPVSLKRHAPVQSDS